MPRRPDVPCASCGTLMWRGTGSRPPGEATCLACRRAGNGPRRRVSTACTECGRSFDHLQWRERKFCSLQCRSIAGARAGVLARYGTLPTPGTKREKDRLRCAKRRALTASAIVEVVDPDVVYARDGWRCHICDKKVDRRLSGRHRLGPTLDHLVPLAAGGEHSYANVALAHRSCNSAKGVKGVAQLALIG